MSKATEQIARIPFDLPATQKAELARLARERHHLPVNTLLRQIVREWIAAEQAEEAATQAEAA